MVGNVFTNFPLPIKIEKFRGLPEFELKVRDFLENRSFFEQFEGLYTIFKKNIDGYYLFRIDNVSINDTIDNYSIYDCFLMSRDFLNINTSSWSNYGIEKLEVFISKPNSIFIKVPITFKSVEIGFKLAFEKAGSVMNWLNGKFGQGGIIDTEKYYFIYATGGARSVWKKNKLSISKNGIETEHNNDSINLVKIEKKQLRKKLINCDKILDSAKSASSNEDKIINYWRFLESYFIGPRYANNSKGEKIRTDISLILLNNEIDLRKTNIALIISNILINTEAKTLNLTISKMKLTQIVNQTELENIDVLKEFQDYYFLNELFSRFDKLEENYNLQNSYEYYDQVFLELFEQRNVLMHKGDYCQSTVGKLLEEVPRLIERFRRIVLESIESLDANTLKDVIIELRANSIRKYLD